MNIKEAKRQVKDTIEAYLATDEAGDALLETAQQRPIFLVGAPGIGKTAIMSQIAEELDMGLVAYSMTHHTRQSALGLPFITHRKHDGVEYDASEYTMSEIVDSVYECIRSTGHDRGILFLDEINCVSETLYPSMLQFLQFKTFGRHRIPEGWIVVTAGNPPEYNRSVHDFDIVTLDRVKTIPVEPDFGAWKSYALSKGAHPAVLTFLETKKDRFYSIKSTLDGKEFVTARGWDDLSDIIRIYERLEKEVDESLISHYVQDAKIAGEFSAYYDLFNKYRDDYKVDSILAGDSEDELIARAKEAPFDERLSLLGLILDAIEPEMGDLMESVDAIVSVRDDLRDMRTAFEAGEISSIASALDGRIEKRSEERSGGGIQSPSRAKRRVLDREIGLLKGLREDLPSKAGDDSDEMSVLAEMFAERADLDDEVASSERRLSNAFSFIDEAFGDAQEMLIFVTELTQRTPSARYVAQFGSDSYYAHNQRMILSDSRKRLNDMVESLEL